MDISTITEAFSDVTVQSPTVGVMLAGLLAVALVFLSAFASGSEIAFFSLSPSDVAELEDGKNPSDRKIQMLREDSERTLATILITNNFVNVMIVMLLSNIFVSIVKFGPKAYWLEFLIMTVFLTFLLLLFGEIMPKVYCRQNPLRFCRRCVDAILFARKIFWPIETILLKSGMLAEKVMKKENHVLSVDELEQALELTDKDDIKNEQSMLQGIIRFGDETAKEVMTSRQDIVDLPINSSYEDVLKCIVDNNYSRIPVYQDNQDNIRGILYIKDLLPHLSKPKSFRWQSLIRPPYFVPETKMIDDLLRDFQENHVHMAIVVDEYGGTSGLVTLEDILEEIVGEIEDEFDPDNKYLTRLSRREWLVDGRFSCDDAIELGWPLEESDDYETIAGWILELCDSVPDIGEVFEVAGYKFKVQSMRGQRISLIRVIAPAETDKKDSESSAEKPAASGAGSADPRDGDE